MRVEADSRDRLGEGRFRLLLLSLLLVILFPSLDGLDPRLRIDLLLRFAVLIGAVRALSRQRRTRWSLALLGSLSLLASALSDGADGWRTAGVALALPFYAGTLGVLAIAVFQQPGVTRDTLYGATCTYLLLALAFGTVFEGLELLVPGSFSLPEASRGEGLTPSFRYFSAVTISTLGYGDVLPVSEAARSLVVLECVLGILYPSVLVARLVALHASGDASVPFALGLRLRELRIGGAAMRFEALFGLQVLQILAHPWLPLLGTRLLGLVVLLAALGVLPRRRRRLAIGIGLGVPAALRFAAGPGSAWMLVGEAFLVVFLLFVTFTVAEHVLAQREVDRNVVSGICCAYLLLGWVFATAYGLVLALEPDALALGAGLGARERAGALLYFSFVTLTTLGYGELVPVAGAARSLASIEALVGVLFPAVLVARLVALYRAAPAG